MKEGWTYKKIKDVAKVFAGQGAPQGDSNYSLDGTPFVKAGNLSDLINGESESSIQKVSEEVALSHKLKLFKAGSVLFAKSGMSCMKGFVYTLKSDCYVVSHLAIITPHSVNSHFLNYYLRYNKPNLLIKDEAYPSISLKDIENLQIPFPPIAEQERIVAELDLLSGIIEKKKEQLKAYDQLAQSIFYDMFGDPFTNEKGWDVKKLGVICEIIAGGDKPNDMSITKTTDYCYPIIANGEGDKGILGYSKTRRVLKDSVTIGARGASIGNCRIVYGGFTPVIRLITLTPKSHVNCMYLYYHAKQMPYYSTGAGQAQLTVPNIKDLFIPTPPLSLQEEFAEKIEAIERQKALVQQSIDETQTMFDCTMDKYFG